MWSLLHSNDFNTITEYLPNSSLVNLRLVCKRLSQLVTPTSFKFISFKMITSDEKMGYISKFGPCFTHLIPSSGYDPSKLNFSNCSKALPNLTYFELSQPEVTILNGYNQIIQHWPNLTSLITNSMNQSSQLNLQNCKQLESIVLLNSDLSSLLSSLLNTNLSKNLKQLYYTPFYLELPEITSCFQQYPNLTLLYLNFLQIPPILFNNCKCIFRLISQLRQLKHCSIQFKLDSSFNCSESTNSQQTLFPPEFKLTKLESFTFHHISLHYYASLPHKLSLDRFDLFIGLNLERLFIPNCIYLKVLDLDEIHGTLLDQLLLSCPNLQTLKAHSPLPKPSVTNQSFTKLKHVQITGFLKDTIEHLELIHPCFPKVIKVGIISSNQSIQSNYYNNWNLIPLIFPNAVTVTLDPLVGTMFPTIEPIVKLHWQTLATRPKLAELVKFIEKIKPIASDLHTIQLLPGDYDRLNDFKHLEAILRLYPTLQIDIHSTSKISTNSIEFCNKL